MNKQTYRGREELRRRTVEHPHFSDTSDERQKVEMSDVERIRLVILGGAGVGKSCIIKRFLLKTYSDKYRATVEDLYNREYDLGSVTLKVSLGIAFNLSD